MTEKYTDHFKKSSYFVEFDNCYHYKIRETSDIRLRHIWDCTDEELENLKNKIKNIHIGTISDNDKIYFDASSKFPKLFLSNSGAPLTRTIKIENATKIVMDKHAIVRSNLFDNIEEYYYVIDELCPQSVFYIDIKSIEENKLDLEKCKIRFGGVWTKVRTLDCDVTEDTVTLVSNYSNKLVTTDSLVVYLNSKFATLDQDQKENMLSLMKSNDPEHNKLAINMVKQFSLSNVLVELLIAIREKTANGYLDTSLTNSVNFKYLTSLIGVTMRNLNTRWGFERETLRAFVDLYKSDLIDFDQKVILWKLIFRGITYQTYDACNDKNYYIRNNRSTFDRYGIPTTLPQREASSGN